MFILINGPFGIGKTTVAELLIEELPHAALYDPERVGFVIRRLPAWFLGRAKQPADYQDIGLWRSLITRGARRRQRDTPIVVVPMAFTNRRHFDALVDALSTDAPVQRICLRAPLDVVRGRLSQRARAEGSEVSDFQMRRSAECVEAHKDPAFGQPVDATGPPSEIVAEICRIVRGSEEA